MWRGWISANSGGSFSRESEQLDAEEALKLVLHLEVGRLLLRYVRIRHNVSNSIGLSSVANKNRGYPL